MIPKPTAEDLLEVLHRQYQLRMQSTAVVPEASIGDSFRSKGNERSVRRIDALVLFLDKRWAVEIKVSMSDLKQELVRPEKQMLWLAHTHSFYFLVAPHLLEYALANVPKHFGIMTTDSYWIQIKRRAPKNKTPLDLPYETIRRMGGAYASTRRELRALKKIR